MKNMSKLIGLFLAISAMRVVSGQFWNPRQQFGSNSDCLADNFGNIGTCRMISECRGIRNFDELNLCRNSRRFGPIVCCPPRRSRRPQRPGTIGGPNGGNGQNGENGQNENIQRESVSQRKCLESYAPPPPPKEGEINFHTTVVGGELTKPGEFPFMAAIGWDNTDGAYDYNCGGFLVEKNFVITAAHCTTLRGVPPTVVRLGGNNLDTPGSDTLIKIIRIISHPRYTASQSYNDIAVMELESGAVTLPACLWPSYDINFQEGTAIGYGHTSFAGRRSSDLMKVNLNIFSNQECSRYYQPGAQIENGLDQSQLCAGDPNRAKDTCQGDSGGPILVNTQNQGKTIPYVIGVTSFGRGCAGEAPSIYTRISSYTRWIESIVWPNES